MIGAGGEEVNAILNPEMEKDVCVVHNSVKLKSFEIKELEALPLPTLLFSAKATFDGLAIIVI